VKRRRHTPEQIIRKLREAERMLGEGKTIPEAAKELGGCVARGARQDPEYGARLAAQYATSHCVNSLRPVMVDGHGAAARA
jgi:hypothetical protein